MDPERPDSASSPPERVEERGLHNPNIVDLIRQAPDAEDVVELIAIQRRAWPADAAAIASMLQDKLNAYFGYVLQGYFHREYERYVGHRVRVVVAWSEAPPPAAEALFVQAARIADEQGVGFAARRADDGLAGVAPWES